MRFNSIDYANFNLRGNYNMIRVSQPELLFVYRIFGMFGLNRKLTALLSSNFMSDYPKYLIIFLNNYVRRLVEPLNTRSKWLITTIKGNITIMPAHILLLLGR